MFVNFKLFLQVSGIVIVNLFIMTFAAMLGDRSIPIEVTTGRVIPTEVTAGQMAAIEWRGIVHRDCSRIVKRSVIGSDGEVRMLDAEGGANITGNYGFTKSFRVPTSTPPGLARYRAEVKFFCNPLHKFWPIESTTPDVPFIVLPSTK